MKKLIILLIIFASSKAFSQINNFQIYSGTVKTSKIIYYDFDDHQFIKLDDRVYKLEIQPNNPPNTAYFLAYPYFKNEGLNKGLTFVFNIDNTKDLIKSIDIIVQTKTQKKIYKYPVKLESKNPD